MRRELRAVWRLSRSTVHALHGVALALWRFPRLSADERHAHIGWWSRKMLRLMGLDVRVDGELCGGGTLLVANHVSWLDIMALHAVAPHARFVSKSDVGSWPLLSRLSEAANTLYLERERKRDALRVVHLVAQALRDGQTVAVFPEGTTSDGRALLPFHANLLQAAVVSARPVQPVALRFSDARDTVSTAVEFVGATTLAQSMWRVACADALVVRIDLLPPRAGDAVDRRALARALQADIAQRLQRG
jgi:1-acyl-sn-glycerol-3-phosphate acyltransferase